MALGWFRKVLVPRDVVSDERKSLPSFSGRVCVQAVFFSKCLAEFPGARHLGSDISLQEVLKKKGNSISMFDMEPIKFCFSNES